jgi:hypothetical protein
MISRLRSGQLLSTIASSSMMYNKVQQQSCSLDVLFPTPYLTSLIHLVFKVVSKLGLLDTSRTAWESDDHDAVTTKLYQSNLHVLHVLHDQSVLLGLIFGS